MQITERAEYKEAIVSRYCKSQVKIKVGYMVSLSLFFFFVVVVVRSFRMCAMEALRALKERLTPQQRPFSSSPVSLGL